MNILKTYRKDYRNKFIIEQIEVHTLNEERIKITVQDFEINKRSSIILTKEQSLRLSTSILESFGVEYDVEKCLDETMSEVS